MECQFTSLYLSFISLLLTIINYPDVLLLLDIDIFTITILRQYTSVIYSILGFWGSDQIRSGPWFELITKTIKYENVSKTISLPGLTKKQFNVLCGHSPATEIDFKFAISGSGGSRTTDRFFKIDTDSENNSVTVAIRNDPFAMPTVVNKSDNGFLKPDDVSGVYSGDLFDDIINGIHTNYKKPKTLYNEYCAVFNKTKELVIIYHTEYEKTKEVFYIKFLDATDDDFNTLKYRLKRGWTVEHQQRVDAINAIR